MSFGKTLGTLWVTTKKPPKKKQLEKKPPEFPFFEIPVVGIACFANIEVSQAPPKDRENLDYPHKQWTCKSFGVQ